MNFDALAHLTGREQEIAAFEKLISDQETVWAMLVNGFSGTGKSLLVDWLRKFKCANIPTAKLTMSRSVHEVQLLGSLADQINPTIGERVSKWLAEERQPLLQYSPSVSMEAVNRGSIENAEQTVNLNLESTFSDMVKLEKRMQRLDFTVAALSTLKESTWVLFVDQYEYLTNPEAAHLLQNLILRLHTSFSGFRVYLTGQSVPEDWFSRHERDAFTLSSFSITQTRKLLDSVGVKQEDLQRSVFKATDGHPLLVSMLIEDVLASDVAIDTHLLTQSLEGLDEPARTTWIYERIVDRFEDPVLRRLATNLSLFEWFDLGLLRSVFGEGIAESSFRELVRRSFVKSLPGGRWQCHEIIRKYLRANREQLDPLEYREIHRKIFQTIETCIRGEEEYAGEQFFPSRLEYITAALNSSAAFSVPQAFKFASLEVACSAAKDNTEYLFGLGHYLANAELPEDLSQLGANVLTLLGGLGLFRLGPDSLNFIEELSRVSLEANKRRISDTLLSMGAYSSFLIGDQERARMFANRAIATNDTIENRVLLIDILATSGAVDEARQQLEIAEAAFGDSPQLHLASARIALTSGDRKTAVTEYAEIIAQFPDASTEARLKLAEILFEDNENEAALIQVQTSLDHDPHNQNALMLRLSILVSQGRLTEVMGSSKDVAMFLPRLLNQVTPFLTLLSDPLMKSKMLAELMYQPEAVPLGVILICMNCLALQGDVENVDRIAVYLENRYAETRAIVNEKKGTARLFAGRHEEAIKILEPLIKLKEHMPDSYFSLALSLGEIGQHERSREVLREWLKDLPGFRDRIDQLMAQSLSKDQGAAAALQYLQDKGQETELGPLAQLTLGQYLAAEGHLEAAIAVLERVIYTQDRDTLPIGSLIESRFQLAILLIETAAYEKARGIAHELIKALPDVPEAMIAVAKIFATLKDEEELRKLLDLQLGNSLVQAEVIVALSQLVQIREPTIEGLWAELERYPERMEILMAIDLLLTSTGRLDELFDLMPRISSDLLKRYQHFQSEVLRRFGPVQEHQLRKQKILTPDLVPVRLALVRALRANGKILEAIRELDEMAALFPETETLGLQSAVEMLIEIGNLDDAERRLIPYMDLTHPPPLIVSALWNLLDAKGYIAQKREFAERVSVEYPGFLELVEAEEFQSRLQEMLEKGDFQTLLELVDTSLKSHAEFASGDPLPIDLLLWKVRASKKSRRFPEALEVLQGLEHREDLEIPSVIEIYLLLGEVLQESQDLEGAEAAFRKGVETDPWNNVCYVSLVNLYKLQERWDEAFEVLKVAVAIKPALIHQYEDELRTLKEMSLSEKERTSRLV
jgi:tetratricopeptide (TPR) repeat protein